MEPDDADVTHRASPKINAHVKLSSHRKSTKKGKDKIKVDDSEYQQYLEDYRRDLMDGFYYMFGDHPRDE